MCFMKHTIIIFAMLLLPTMGLYSCKKKNANSMPTQPTSDSTLTLDSALSYVPKMVGIKYLAGTDSLFYDSNAFCCVSNQFDTFAVYVINDTEISTNRFYIPDTLEYVSYNNVAKTIEFEGSFTETSFNKFSFSILYFYQNDSISYKEYGYFSGDLYVHTVHTYN